jgi:hypothetical protein
MIARKACGKSSHQTVIVDYSTFADWRLSIGRLPALSAEAWRAVIPPRGTGGAGRR